MKNVNVFYFLNGGVEKALIYKIIMCLSESWEKVFLTSTAHYYQQSWELSEEREGLEAPAVWLEVGWMLMPTSSLLMSLCSLVTIVRSEVLLLGDGSWHLLSVCCMQDIVLGGGRRKGKARPLSRADVYTVVDLRLSIVIASRVVSKIFFLKPCKNAILAFRFINSKIGALQNVWK